MIPIVTLLAIPFERASFHQPRRDVKQRPTRDGPLRWSTGIALYDERPLDLLVAKTETLGTDSDLDNVYSEVVDFAAAVVAFLNVTVVSVAVCV